MKEFAKKIISGVGLGLGFTVAAIAVIYFSTGMMMGKMTEEAYSEAEGQMSEGFGYKKFNAESGLNVKTHKERKIENGVEILAEVENTGSDTWSSVSVEVELFDEKGQFVDECSGYLRGKLEPAQVKNLKIKCGGCANSQFSEYSKYTIAVVDASSF